MPKHTAKERKKKKKEEKEMTIDGLKVRIEQWEKTAANEDLDNNIRSKAKVNAQIAKERLERKEGKQEVKPSEVKGIISKSKSKK